MMAGWVVYSTATLSSGKDAMVTRYTVQRQLGATRTDTDNWLLERMETAGDWRRDEIGNWTVFTSSVVHQANEALRISAFTLTSETQIPALPQ
jgi:hypothetical protein